MSQRIENLKLDLNIRKDTRGEAFVIEIGKDEHKDVASQVNCSIESLPGSREFRRTARRRLCRIPALRASYDVRSGTNCSQGQ